MRAFFAVDLPDDLAPRVADAQAALGDAAGLALVDPEQTHVTLKFLGDIAEDNDDTTPTLDDVIAAGKQAVETANVDPFECAVEGFGVFPSLD